jgi:hypothetical protein
VRLAVAAVAIGLLIVAYLVASTILAIILALAAVLIFWGGLFYLRSPP